MNGLIGVIHVSTTTVYFTIYTTPDFKELLSASEEIQLLMPRDGWFEQDATEIMTAIYQCSSEACDALIAKGFNCEDVLCIGITNQRETTVMWNETTGQPLCNAIVWNDIRTTGIVDRMNKSLEPEKLKVLHRMSGLRLSPYFSALKIKWMQENVAEVRAALREGVCKAGTLDSWIIWNLTKGEEHVTDVTNASRTLLMNIHTLCWESDLLELFKIKCDILPKIRSSSEVVGRVRTTSMRFSEVFICGVIGNQQAALVGQSCLERGQANCTYNSGCFVLYNTGLQRVFSTRGLLTTVAYKMGPNANAVYALEGSVAVGGRVFEWLTTKMRILPSADEAEKYAAAVQTSAGLYFVPAFTGLYAPYWSKDARGTIIGLTAAHTGKHIVRAAHDAIAYQIYDILESMHQDCDQAATKLCANGKFCENTTLMQLQSDIAGVPLFVSVRNDRANLGAAYCAAHAYSFDLSAVTASTKQIKAPYFKEYKPSKSAEERKQGYDKWQRAVKLSMNWAVEKPTGRQLPWAYILITLILLLTALGFYYMLHLHVLREKAAEGDNATLEYAPDVCPRLEMTPKAMPVIQTPKRNWFLSWFSTTPEVHTTFELESSPKFYRRSEFTPTAVEPKRGWFSRRPLAAHEVETTFKTAPNVEPKSGWFSKQPSEASELESTQDAYSRSKTLPADEPMRGWSFWRPFTASEVSNRAEKMSKDESVDQPKRSWFFVGSSTASASSNRVEETSKTEPVDESKRGWFFGTSSTASEGSGRSEKKSKVEPVSSPKRSWFFWWKSSAAEVCSCSATKP